MSASTGATRAGPRPGHAWLLLALPLLVLSGVRGLWSPDEPRYAQVAREIWTGGDALVMHLCGEIYPDKPPLLFWLGSVLGELSGWSEPAMRLVSIGAVLATAWMVRRLAATWFGPREATWAPIVFSTTALVVWLGSRFQIDPLLTALCTGALWLLVRAPESARPGATRLAAGLLLGLGTLAKGPVAWSNVGLVLLAWLALPGRRAGTRWTPATIAGFVALALLPAAAWALAAIAREPELAGPLLFGEHLSRVAEARSHPGPPWEPALEMTVFLLPWTLPAVAALLVTVRSWGSASQGAKRCVLWWGVLLLFFSIVSEKRPLYLMPAYPAAAILVARWIAWRTEHGVVPAAASRFRWTTAPSAVASTALGVAACFTFAVADPLGEALPDASGLWWRGLAAGLPVAALGALAVRAAWRLQTAAWAGWQTAAVAAAVVAVAALFGPSVDARKSPRAVAAALAARPEQPRIVPAVGLRPEGYRFYSQRPVVDGRLHEALATEGEGFLALVEAGHFVRLREKLPEDLHVVGSWRVSSREVLLVARHAQ